MEQVMIITNIVQTAWLFLLTMVLANTRRK